jgi:hypothetical protein
MALADIGLPMIFVQWPLMLYALVPVIVLESLLVRRWVSLTYQEAFVGASIANVVTTLAGVPLAWGAMLAIEIGTMGPLSAAADEWHWRLEGPVFQVIGFILSVAWLPPLQDYFNWVVPLSVAALLVPSFFISVWLERLVCVKMWVTCDEAAVRRGVYRANLASYLLLFILACGWADYLLVSKLR